MVPQLGNSPVWTFYLFRNFNAYRLYIWGFITVWNSLLYFSCIRDIKQVSRVMLANEMLRASTAIGDDFLWTTSALGQDFFSSPTGSSLSFTVTLKPKPLTVTCNATTSRAAKVWFLALKTTEGWFFFIFFSLSNNKTVLAHTREGRRMSQMRHGYFQWACFSLFCDTFAVAPSR